MEGKTFEDATFELLSRLSPIKLKRSDIPFDSVRELVLDEVNGSGRKSRRETLKSSSATVIPYSSPDLLNSNDSTDKGFTAFFDDEDTRMSATSIDCDSEDSNISRLSCDEDSRNLSFGQSHSKETNTACKLSNYRIRRLQELRNARLNGHRTNVSRDIHCDEHELPNHIDLIYNELLTDGTPVVKIFYVLTASLDAYFRSRTWDNNCVTACCEFVRDNIYRSCDQLNDANEQRDGLRLNEFMVQVIISLYLYRWRPDKVYVNDAINKLRIIYMVSDPLRMRTFLEESVTDLFVGDIPDCLASIYDELCISLPPDLAHLDNGFKMMDDVVTSSSRRSCQAKQLAELLEETNDEPERREEKQRRGIKRERPDDGYEPESPSRRKPSAGGAVARSMRIVLETPDEKLRNIKEEVVEAIEETVNQTPMGKLRSNGRRCSRRLSELVKLSEERTSVPRAAAINAQKLLNGSTPKDATPITRRTTRQLLFANNSPASNLRARKSLVSQFEAVAEKNKSTPTRMNGVMRLRAIKREAVDEEYEKAEESKRTTRSETRKSVLSVNFDLSQTQDSSKPIAKSPSKGTLRSPSKTSPSKRSATEETEDGEKLDGLTLSEILVRNRARRLLEAKKPLYMSSILLNVHNPEPTKYFDQFALAADRMKQTGAVEYPRVLHRVMRQKPSKGRISQSQEDSSSAADEYDGDDPFEAEADN